MLLLPGLASAQRGSTRHDTTTTPANDPALRGLRWRLVGPFRGGRVVAVTGDPRRRGVFYFGAVAGGVWKTTNAGISWTNITDGVSSISSVGAIAVAPSDPNVIYVGEGEADFREDLTYGNGVDRSTDGGRTWTHLGLDDTRHIAAIRVDPNDPDVVYVAATGHAFGPNPMRGVYRSRDGGRTWRRVLFADDTTGAIDLALDPTNPRILYAAMWRFRRSPWGFTAGGGRSGLFRSTDGGDHWTELTRNPGMPSALIGRIGIAVSPVRPSRLWASVEAADSTGGIFRSDDAGSTWHRVNAEQKFMVRPWYFSGVTADPANENTVYVLNLDTWRSVDGGATFEEVRAPHGDDHTLWIDPADPDRMIEGNDGGATVSLDGGDTWSSIDNQPTAQFYHVITDDQFPYRLYGAQQDNTTVSIPSRSDWGAIRKEDWWPVGGGESGYIAPRPHDPSIVFAGSYMGTLSRYDHRTLAERDVSAWLNNYDGLAARDVPYRFQWTFPILFSPHDPRTLYIAAQQVLRSTDDGDSWQAISPDLTRHDTATMGPVGGPVTYDMTGTEWYATVFALAESPVATGELWAGSDDGLVHLTRDGGKTWTDVTPRDFGAFTRVSIIEPSHFDAGTAYLAANRYQQDDFRPYLFRTTDYGHSWTRIGAGIPDGAYTRVIREDPGRRGLLYAGTETGVYVSFDDGAHWQSLQLNLPRTPVRDLAIRGHDLLAATHGRAFWSLDDITPLRQLADSVRRAATYLFAPDTALRYPHDAVRRPFTGHNPPNGAIIDFWFAKKPSGPVELAFLDSAGAVIRSFSSADSTGAEPLAAASRDAARGDGGRDTTGAERTRERIETGTDSASYAPSDSVVPTRMGANRFVWDLRFADARKLEGIVVDAGTSSGPRVPPGRYTVRLTADGTTLERRFTVVEDPRVRATPADLAALLALSRQVVGAIDSTARAVERIEALQKQLRASTEATKGQPYASRVKVAADSVIGKLETIRQALAEVHSHADEITLHYPVVIYNKLLSLNLMVQSADAPPTSTERAVYRELQRALDGQLARLAAVERADVAGFNAMMRGLGVG
ncbi:MAG TPA: glycosyl hydrolase, partial [Gemmatimonadaceae bacterium]